ncbi:MAG: hypothetical protein QXO84_00245 [Candidatus Aenigmatarchaeota archaeon]
MIFPVCSKCLKNIDICDSCKNNLNANIDKAEIEMYKKINNALRVEKHIKDAKIKRVFSDSKFTIIVCGKNDVGKIIGKNGIIAKKIEKKLNTDVRIVSDESDINDFIKDVLSPSNIKGINVVFDGEKEIFKVKMPLMEKNLLKLSPEFFKQVFYDVFNKFIEIEFE